MSDPIQTAADALRAQELWKQTLNVIAQKVHDARRKMVDRPNALLLGDNDYDAVRMIPMPYAVTVTQTTGEPPVEEIYGLRIIHVAASNYFEVALIV